MIPYVLLMFVPLFFSVVAFSWNIPQQKNRSTLVIGMKKVILDHSLLIPMFFLLLLVLLAFRDESIGRDLSNYKYYFFRFSALDIREVFNESGDVLYIFLNWIIGRVTESYQVFLAIIALITVLPIAMTYSKDRVHSFLKIVLFMNMSNFVMLFSGLRQSVAVAMGLIAYEFVVRKKTICFLLFALLALGFHHSAFMVFLYYPLYYMTFKKKHLWFIIPSIAVIFVFNRPIFTIATAIINRFSREEYVGATNETGAYMMVFLFALFAIFSYVMPDEKKMDRETLGLRNFLLMAVVLQCFAPIHTLAMRMNYYFIIFIPILIPKILKYAKSGMRDVAEFAKYIMIVFFVLYYLVNVYNSCRTGISALDTYPYVPFWR